MENTVKIKNRWLKKRSGIETLANSIQRLRYNITKDLQSDDEKVFLTALGLDIMIATGERVGNGDSAGNGHYGVTYFKKNHVTTDGNKIIFKYKGKSGVSHEKIITNERMAKNIEKAKEISPSRFLLCTSNMFRINEDRINRYLVNYEI